MPRPASENRRIRDERQEHILRAAAGLFARKGLMATTIAEIAATAQVSHGLAYHYFASKEEIFRLLVMRAMQGTERVVHEAHVREGTVSERLRWLISEMIDGARRSANYMLIVQQAIISEAVSAEVRELVLQGAQNSLDLLSELFREGQDNDEIISGDARQLAMLLLSCVQGIVAGAVMPFKQPDIEAETMLRLFLKR
ncbi:TetR/AcrR family transcriptional regulator [Ktedonosporobacter rubrisoli]|uniref:TetR/AcrR family transcriptional regulator n=1 Tax=Ktedonosporobacter rubrisoli TaxID=2509675 RepID=A0A4P6JLC2_KTERU|nr:TetR/AcrR family transcriptional regulator [Ktedonosporobacter rubrisoli]QBD75984.1 TetR/AcrR family transcriptional regulator [Ktedonosporobacter rubrisoli]